MKVSITEKKFESVDLNNYKGEARNLTKVKVQF